MTKALIRTLALWLALWPALVVAQQYPVVPDKTVIGRIGTGSGSGPSGAVPFSTLYANLTGGNTAAANQIPVFPGNGGQPVPTTVGGSGGLFDAICSSAIGQAWVRLSSGWGCSSLGYINPVWWGADPTGVADSTSAFTSVLAIGGSISVPCGTFKITAQKTLSISGTKLVGRGPSCTTITQATASTGAFLFGAFLTGLQISDMTITRTSTGGIGIDASASTSQGMLSNLVVNNYLNEIVLGTTDRSVLMNVNVGFGTGDGIVATNGAGGVVGIQWQWINVISGQNTGRGAAYLCNGTGSMSLGDIDHFATFANTSFGIAFVGSATCPINGIRMANSFMGQDGNSEIFLSTFGSFPHVFNGVTLELAGTSPTGPTLGTATSNSGDGITISANEPSVTIANSTINNVSLMGVRNSGSNVMLLGNAITNNGAAGSGSAYGVAASGRTIAIGNTIGNTGAGTNQVVGINVLSGSDHSIISDNDVRANSSFTISNTNGGTHTIIKNNDGYNPVGLTAGTSTGTSASTITASASPETHYITQSANFNAVVKSGATSLCTVPSATVPCMIDLGPNEAYTVTWTTTQPTYSKFVH